MVFSTSNGSEGNSTAVSSSVPRAFPSNEFLENETGYWDKQLQDGQSNVDKIDINTAKRMKRAPHVSDNRSYTPITEEGLQERTMASRKRVDNKLIKKKGRRFRRSSKIPPPPELVTAVRMEGKDVLPNTGRS